MSLKLKGLLLWLVSAAAMLAAHGHGLSQAVQAETAVATHEGPASIYPEIAITPGATNPNVTQDNIQQTICVPGFTKNIRPRAAMTNKIKRQQLKAYHDTVPQSPPPPLVGGKADTSQCVEHSADPRCYQLDHLISLELGGCPDCVTNLWPEPYNPKPGAHEKDEVEHFLHTQVCSGAMSLEEAQHEVVQDWYKVYLDNHVKSNAAKTADDEAPRGATAKCRDGSYSFSKHHSGTCSRHGGVDSWIPQQ